MQRGRWQLRNDEISSDKHARTFCTKCSSYTNVDYFSQHDSDLVSGVKLNLSQDCRNSSSRSLLAGEPSDTLGLLRLIDSKSRHRRIKSQRLHEHVAATKR